MIINRRDKGGNTAVHYAAQFWPKDTVRALLRLGANIGVKNWRGEIPLHKIDPATLEAFLDEDCVSRPDRHDRDHDLTSDLNSDDFSVTFHYNFLAPPVSEQQLELWDEEKQAELEREALPETDTLWYLRQSQRHRHLMKHPVITSFLWLKWHRIRRFFNRNLRFYALFVFCLTWYIFAR